MCGIAGVIGRNDQQLIKRNFDHLKSPGCELSANVLDLGGIKMMVRRR